MPARALQSTLLLGLCAALIGLAASVKAAEFSWAAERGRVRDVRIKLREQVHRDRVLRSQKNADLISDLISVASERRTPGQNTALERMITQIEELAPQRAEELHAELQRLPEEPGETIEQDDRWPRRFEAAREEFVRRPAELLDRSLSLGASDIAAELVSEILAFDPDYRPVRELLGQTRHEGQWLGRFAYSQAQKGLIWDDRFGWKVAAEAERYENGEYFDLIKKTWLPMSAANAAHSVYENPWQIQTEHLALTGTVELVELAQTARRLETYYSRMLAEYPKFFVKGDGYRRFALGAGEHAPLSVAMYRNREQYRKACPRSVVWSRGSFDSEMRASLFYGVEPVLMYHEFAHQMFTIFAGGNQSPAWLSEGVAVYCESARDVDGQLVVGGIPPKSRVAKYLEDYTRGEAMPIADLVRLSDLRVWAATDAPQKQYDAAGALVAFCMEAREGAFRADFIDFMRDSYRGAATGHALWEYLGYDRDSFFSVYEGWLLQSSRRMAAGLLSE